MSTAIDSAGRLVIPKSVRDAAGIRPGTPLEVRFRDGRIEIEPAPIAVTIETVGGVAVATARHPVPVLSAEIVRATRDQSRDERG
ncbi:MAG: AbrB family looped-hinge helix DNA binding protein [Myxococcota bacterium]|jgi:AbrB family looped-hinge helix DNA binding protein